jgi:hypothetical protein
MVTLTLAVNGHWTKSCATSATWSKTLSRASREVGTPSQKTPPQSGRYSPTSSLASVLLPEPFSPTNATTSPRRTVMLTPHSAGSVAFG